MTSLRVLRPVWLLVAMLLSGVLQSAAADDPPVIAAASDLQFALDELRALFTQQSGADLRITYGSSGQLRQQISQGAPFELFLSADEDYVYALANESLTVDTGTLYGVGRLVIFTPRGSPVRPDAELEDLALALEDGRLKKLAIANPEHAPYGRAAREALIKAEIWDAIKDYLVLGENVSQAAQFAASGAAQAGLIPYSMALAPALSARGRFELLPSEWHRPLRQRMVLLKKAGPIVRRFYDFVQTPAAAEVLTRYGFAVPEK